MSAKSAVKSDKRHFTIAGSDIGFTGGRYSTDKSNTPSSAARRAAAMLYRMIDNKQNKSEWKKYASFKKYKGIKFMIREVTQGSSKESYYFEAQQEPLPAPKVIKFGNTEVTVTSKLVVKKRVPGTHRGGDSSW